MMNVPMADNCPYCGGKPVLFNFALKTIECESCTELSVTSGSVQGAIDKWNESVRIIRDNEVISNLSGDEIE